ncbi:MAG TPA: hypothetical protein VLA11_04790 [Woeseiaceae bacterium]|jgi:hypothetical protein|nr:hypothetical protein [Woeseiaceae bacterium]
MRHAIIVVGSEEQRGHSAPKLAMLDDESTRTTTWYACTNQDKPERLLDDVGNVILRMFLAPVLAYRIYLLVQNTKLWSGKRPLLLLRGRGLSSRIAAYAGTWGGGDVVKVDRNGEPPLGPTRFLLDDDGNLKIRGG